MLPLFSNNLTKSITHYNQGASLIINIRSFPDNCNLKRDNKDKTTNVRDEILYNYKVYSTL